MMGETVRQRGPLVCVVGARPNYMKMAPLVRAFVRSPIGPVVSVNVVVSARFHSSTAWTYTLYVVEMP